jgi:hypothetical protein
MPGETNRIDFAENDELFLDQCFGTLALCSFLVLVTWIWFSLASTLHESYESGNEPLYGRIAVALLVVPLFIMFSASVLSRRRIDLFDISLSYGFRNKCLPAVALGIIVVLGLMVICSGGAINSGFSHFLIAASSLSVVVARTWKVRFIVTILTLLFYWVAIAWYFEPKNIPLEEDVKLFNGICTTVAVGIAMIAAWRNPPARRK